MPTRLCSHPLYSRHTEECTRAACTLGRQVSAELCLIVYAVFLGRVPRWRFPVILTSPAWPCRSMIGAIMEEVLSGPAATSWLVFGFLTSTSSPVGLRGLFSTRAMAQAAMKCAGKALLFCADFVARTPVAGAVAEWWPTQIWTTSVPPPSSSFGLVVPACKHERGCRRWGLSTASAGHGSIQVRRHNWLFLEQKYRFLYSR